MNRNSWISVSDGSDFPLENLPYGVFRHGGAPAHVGVAIGDKVLDVTSLARFGFLDDLEDGAQLFGGGSLDAFLAAGRPAWSAVRRRLAQLLGAENGELRDARKPCERCILRQADVTMELPFTVRDYVDFYSSLQHATNLGKIVRPNADPLLPNWRHLPVGYHGRAGSVVVSGTPVVRPSGQTKSAEDERPSFGPSRSLDFELEVGFVTGDANALGTPIATRSAREHIFGFVLLNDWSARDIQTWEYQPLGPFLSKSFATSISPWVVPLDALQPYFVAGPVQEPPVLDYLRCDEAWALDLNLEVQLNGETISRTNSRNLYWNVAQQLAHATSNGARALPGDLFASGTISGSEPGSYGSMIELTWRGARPIALRDGSQRAFLNDGDTVRMTGWCGGNGKPRVGFGEVNGTVLPAK